ncbi:hypothetical protein ACR6HW_03500 [Fusibacter sp. JL298sf-3]
MNEVLMILLAFCGGVFGALVGALPAFVFTGLIGLTGIAITAAGGTVDLVGTMAFGAFFGPHIAFTGGVAAAALAYKRKQLDSGANILMPLAKYNDPLLLLAGGAFGVLGYLFNALYGRFINLPTDTIALSVITVGLIVRCLFGKSGLLGDRSEKNCAYFPTGKPLVFWLLTGAAVGLLVSYYTLETGIVTLGFCISAASLIFTQMGFPVPATHHIALVSALAASASGNLWMGMVFGVVAAILGEAIGRTFNFQCDTHVDPPAFTISICACAILLIF